MIRRASSGPRRPLRRPLPRAGSPAGTPLPLECQVRTGPAGWWDRFVGPGASPVENAGTFAFAAAGALAGDRRLGPGSSIGSRALMRLVAFDLWGGAWANNTPATVAWYERPGQGPAEHLAFAAPHLLHAGAIAFVDQTGRRRTGRSAARWALGHYVWMRGSTAVVSAAPRRARLPIAAAATGAGLLLDRRLGRSASAPWFAPVYYTKLVIGHAAGSLWHRG